MSNFRKVFITVTAGACFLWNMILLLFLMFSDKGATAFCTALACIGGAGSVYILINTLTKPLNISDRYRRVLFTLSSLAICFILMLQAPYSPAHDSMDMCDFLNNMLRGLKLGKYGDMYLSFFGTNRICMYMYLPFVNAACNVKNGSIAANCFFLLTAVFCISDIVYKKYGAKRGEICLCIMPAFVPYMMMSGPYIYPPSVFLSSLALCLFYSKKMRWKILSAVLFGILTVMRPTGAAFWIILMVAYLFLRGIKNLSTNITFTIVLMLICLCVNSGMKILLYETKMYPYPDFTNSATEWTLEIGLRPQGRETGKCTYTAFGRETFDEISTEFAKLWSVYEETDDNNTYKIKLMNEKLNRMIIDRAFDTVFSDWESFYQYIKYKYINMFSDEYRPYYYAVNLTDDNFGENMYKNYEWRYFLSENALLIAFALACAFLCIRTAIGVWKKRKYPLILMCTALSVMAALCAFILLTEVGKRLIFDLYTPICVVICAVYSEGIESVCNKLGQNAKSVCVCVLTSALFIGGVRYFYSMYNLNMFKNCVRSYLDYGTIVLTLEKPVEEKGCLLWYPDGTDLQLYGRQNIILPLRRDDRQILEVTLPNGKIQYVINYELNKFSFK